MAGEKPARAALTIKKKERAPARSHVSQLSPPARGARHNSNRHRALPSGRSSHRSTHTTRPHHRFSRARARECPPVTSPVDTALTDQCVHRAHSVTAQFECCPPPPGTRAQQGATWHLPSGCVCQTNKSGAPLSCVHCVHHNREQTRRRGRGGGRGRRCLEGIGVVGRATVHCATATIGRPRTIG